ncbi:MAG: protoheme IX farnesyltransferase, partial [Acidimicrobiia bacterium]|nr:protoheme IX farnesyltransferase [Acidimicrobiia bacterium]
LVFGATLGVAGFAWLLVTTNLLAAALSTAGLLFYVFVYTLWLKRTTTQNIVIGGAAGSVPALVGWAAVTGDLAVGAWIMFAIIFFWTPPHFWALALRYRDDYSRADVPMLPVVVGERPTLDAVVAYSVLVTGVSLLLYIAAPVGWFYLAAAIVLGIVLIAASLRLRAEPKRAMSFFGYSNVYLAGIFVAMAVGAVIG